MRAVGVFYQTKRGEKIDNQFADSYLHTCKELLYIDYYFKEKFLSKFDRENKDLPYASDRISFTHIARTIYIAFVALAARYHQGNITDKDVTALTNSPTSPDVCKMLRNLDDIKFLLPVKLYTDAYDAALDKLFTAFIYNGTDIYSDAKESSSKVTETNFFKDDRNYYKILKRKWRMLKREIYEIFAEV